MRQFAMGANNLAAANSFGGGLGGGAGSWPESLARTQFAVGEQTAWTLLRSVGGIACKETASSGSGRFTQNCISLCVDIGAAQLQHLRDFCTTFATEREDGKKHAMVQVECKE
jgi:hypothetical protein